MEKESKVEIEKGLNPEDDGIRIEINEEGRRIQTPRKNPEESFEKICMRKQIIIFSFDDV